MAAEPEPEPEPEPEAGPKVFDEDSHPREGILFEQIDINGDHVLQKEEVEKHFERLGLPTVAGELLKELDKNNDGQIDFEEFVAGWEPLPRPPRPRPPRPARCTVPPAEDASDSAGTACSRR